MNGNGKPVSNTIPKRPVKFAIPPVIEAPQVKTSHALLSSRSYLKAYFDLFAYFPLQLNPKTSKPMSKAAETANLQKPAPAMKIAKGRSRNPNEIKVKTKESEMRALGGIFTVDNGWDKTVPERQNISKIKKPSPKPAVVDNLELEIEEAHEAYGAALNDDFDSEPENGDNEFYVRKRNGKRSMFSDSDDEEAEVISKPSTKKSRLEVNGLAAASDKASQAQGTSTSFKDKPVDSDTPAKFQRIEARSESESELDEATTSAKMDSTTVLYNDDEECLTLCDYDEYVLLSVYFYSQS